jgi:hypothetical protein
MKIKSVPLARAFAYLSLEELTFGTGVAIRDLIAALNKKCRFLLSPNTPEQLDLGKGVTFEQGDFDGMVIKKLTVFPLVMHLDGADSTDNARRALFTLLRWGKDEFGLNFDEESAIRWAFVSDVVFETDFPILTPLNTVLNTMSRRISGIIKENLREDLEYAPAKFWLAHDPNRRSASLAPFTIERRGLTLPEENAYYSEAPVPTADHILLLEEFEQVMRRANEGR